MNGSGDIDLIEFIRKNFGLSPIGLFKEFVTSSKLVKQRATCWQINNGARAGNMDFPLYRYLFSLGFQIDKINEVYEQIKYANTEASHHIAQLKLNSGGISYKPLIDLTHLFEYYIFLLSRTLSTIGNVNLFIFEAEGLCSYNFNKQRQRILDGYDIFCLEYSTIMHEISWYDEDRLVRDNTAHFIGGFTSLKKDDQGNTRFIYTSWPIVDNVGDVDDKIELDICQAMRSYNRGFNVLLDRVGLCYLRQLEPETIWHIADHNFERIAEVRLINILNASIK